MLIYLEPRPNVATTPYIVLGKYLNPRKDNGCLYYVTDWTEGSPFKSEVDVTHHEHLITAIAKVHELAETHNARG